MSQRKQSHDSQGEIPPSSTHHPAKACDQCRIKKTRCGRERPHCFNCRRLGQNCEWSGQGKRLSQTTVLSHNLKKFGNRLEQLERSVSAIQSLLELAKPKAVAKSLHSGLSSEIKLLDITQPPSSWSPPPTPAKMNRCLGRHRIVCSINGSERYYGSTSLASIVHELSESVLRPLSMDESEPIVSQGAANVREKINLLLAEEESFALLHDGSRPSSPPLAMLDAMIDPYFSELNWHLPLWSKKKFRNLICSIYAGAAHIEDRAHAICFSNMVLLTLTAKSLQSRARYATQPSYRQSGSSMDYDLIKPFLANAKRALQNLELLLSPRLVNVQALLSLCLVAQQHFTPSTFKMLFNLAVQVAKSIGLQHPDYAEHGGDPEVVQERKNIFYSLYIIDKAVSWNAGSSASFCMSDVDPPLILQGQKDEASSHLVARFKIAQIEEEAYLRIYSCQAMRKTDSELSQHVSSLNMMLQNWFAEYGPALMDEIHGEKLPSSFKSELIFAFHSTRMMVDWPIYKELDSHSRFLSDARTCLKVLLQLWSTTSELGNYATLPRLIASHPAIYLLALFTHSLSYNMVEQDLELLRSFVHVLEKITEASEMKSHITELYGVSNHLVEFVSLSKFPSPSRHSTQPEILLGTPSSINLNSNQSVLPVFDQISSTPPGINGYSDIQAIDSPMLFPSMDFESGFLHGYSLDELTTSPDGSGNGQG